MGWRDLQQFPLPSSKSHHRHHPQFESDHFHYMLSSQDSYRSNKMTMMMMVQNHPCKKAQFFHIFSLLLYRTDPLDGRIWMCHYEWIKVVDFDVSYRSAYGSHQYDIVLLCILASRREWESKKLSKVKIKFEKGWIEMVKVWKVGINSEEFHKKLYYFPLIASSSFSHWDYYILLEFVAITNS